MKKMHYDVKDIRHIFAEQLGGEDYVTDKTGVKTIELLGFTFLADEPTIFGKVNDDYVERELAWYNSQSLNVNDIPPPVPAIWKAVATPEGLINSNYGWAIYSEENGYQYENALRHIRSNPDTRRASMIYTRPTMHNDFNKDGMSDFMCTHVVDYLVRDGKINAVVKMRSNDGWAGYRNDWAWQKHVLENLATDTGYSVGDIFWQASSIHIYEKQFYLVHHFLETGEISISKEEYDKIYLK